MTRIPVGLQLFSVRGECEKNLMATLKAVAGLGYVGVEPWGYNGEKEEWMGLGGRDFRDLLDSNRLKCCGMHITTGALLGDNLARTVSLNKTMGNKFVIIAADSQRMASLEGIKELAAILNEAAAKLAQEHMQTGYHAHAFDFVKIDGEPAWNHLFGMTNPEVVMQMDIGNCASGGGDPMDGLRRFPGRARTVHLKDFGGAPGSVIGEGKADWPEIFRLCETVHATEWYVVEEGGDDGFGFDICGRSLANLRSMGK